MSRVEQSRDRDQMECRIAVLPFVLDRISENLHRAELTQLQRKEQIAEWIKLTDENVQSAGLRQIEESKRADGRGHRPEGGLSAAAREIGVKETSAREAIRVASLSDEAKAAAVKLGLDDNRSVLLEAGFVASEIHGHRQPAAQFRFWVHGPAIRSGRPPPSNASASLCGGVTSELDWI